jgi:hypothetical protein
VTLADTYRLPDLRRESRYRHLKEWTTLAENRWTHDRRKLTPEKGKGEVTLPTFLGIGAPRSGTTWLNVLLASHPQVYTPSLRDEINFFDRYYERGLDWYERLFPPPEQADRYVAMGEISPQYLEGEECPGRIYATLPHSKLLVMLRHPIDRAYSQYGFYVQRRNYRGSFEEFLVDVPRSLQRGFYSRYLARYLRHFDRSQILALIFEEAVKEVKKTKASLAGFLDIDVDKFPPSSGSTKVNPSSTPTFQSLYGFVAITGRQLREWHLEPLVDFVMRSRIPHILARGKPLPPLGRELKQRLSSSYEAEFDALERCMQIDLDGWRS